MTQADKAPNKHYLLKLKDGTVYRFEGAILKADTHLVIKPVDAPVQEYYWPAVDRITVGFRPSELPSYNGVV